MITQAMLREEMEYRDGKFYWLRRRQGRQMGRPIGTPDSEGYLRVGIDGKSYLLHRLAWLYVYGEWPTGIIDHINRVPSDNRIENLRDVSQHENALNNCCSVNRPLPQHIVRHHNGFRVDITTIRGKTRSKTFQTIEEAIEAKKLILQKI